MIKQILISITFFLFFQWVNIALAASNNNYWHLPVPLQGTMPKAHDSPAFGIQAEKCGLCHPKIYNQWQSSRHALASGPGLLGQLPAFDEDIVNDCLNCHAPRTEQQQSWEKNNDSQLHGIDCSACHLRKHLRHSSKANSLTPHGEVKSLKLFQQSEFCATCHQFGDDGILVNGKPLENTFEEWQASRYAREGIHCQTCHMRNNHSFKGIHDKTMTREGLGIEVTRNATGISLHASNVGSGHALPTYITPRIRLQIESVDGKEQVEHLIQRSMKWSTDKGWVELSDTRLQPDQSITLKLPLTMDQAATVKVIVEPDADYHERVYPLLIEQLAEDLSPKAMKQLESARHCSGQSIYVLYSYDCPSETNTCVENTP